MLTDTTARVAKRREKTVERRFWRFVESPIHRPLHRFVSVGSNFITILLRPTKENEVMDQTLRESVPVFLAICRGMAVGKQPFIICRCVESCHYFRHQIGVLVDGKEEVLPPAWRCVDRSYENHYSANLNTGRYKMMLCLG